MERKRGDSREGWGKREEEGRIYMGREGVAERRSKNE